MKKTIYLLLLCVVGVLFSCSEDEGIKTKEAHDKSHKMGYKKSIVSFEDMKAKLSSTNGQALSLFSNIANKGGDDYIQAIDSSYIIQYGNDTLTTYTMRVSTIDDENYSYSNLIIRSKNGETEEFIAHYSPTEVWQMAHNNGEYLPYEGSVLIVNSNGKDILGNDETAGKTIVTCTYSIEPIYDPDGCSCGGGTIIGYEWSVSCHSSSDGSPNGGGGTGGNNGDPGGNTNWGGGPTDPISGDWGGQGTSYTLTQLMNDFFPEGTWVEVQNPPEGLPSFDHLLDAYDYIYGEINYGTGGELVNIQNNDLRVTHYKVKFWDVIWGERGVRMYISQTRNDGSPRPNVSSINSQWYGASFYNTWEQHENYDVDSPTNCSNCKKITLYGTLTQGFEYEGHGFFVKTEYKIQFLLDKLGNINNVYWWNID